MTVHAYHPGEKPLHVIVICDLPFDGLLITVQVPVDRPANSPVEAVFEDRPDHVRCSLFILLPEGGSELAEVDV